MMIRIIELVLNSSLSFVLCANVKPLAQLANYKCKRFIKLSPAVFLRGS